MKLKFDDDDSFAAQNFKFKNEFSKMTKLRNCTIVAAPVYV